MSRTLITPEGIASYAYVFRPQASMNPGEEPKYAITLLLDEDADLSKLKKACLDKAEDKFGSKAKEMIKRGKLRWPFRSGNEDYPDDELYADKTFIKASSSDKPQIVDEDRKPITDETEFYSGALCRISLFPFAYERKGNKGISFILNNIQKLGEGERISGRTSAADDFGDPDDETGFDDDDDFL